MLRFPIAMIILLSGRTDAHDLWLVPQEASQAGMPSVVKAISGTKFPKGDHAPDPAKFARRIVIFPNGAEGKLEAAGTEDMAGLLRFTPTDTGVYMVAIETTPKLISLDAAAFNSYLVSDGLTHVYLLRAKEGSLDKPAKERYSKFPKAILRVGSGKGDPTKPVGTRLEIVPLRDPLDSKTGDTLKIRVLFSGKPLPEANLGWDHPGDGELPVGTVRTNENGEALVPISKQGLMTIRLTHMTRPKMEEFEWESFWTSLTFYVPK